MLVIALLMMMLFGPQKLEEFGRALGLAMREYSLAKNEGQIQKKDKGPVEVMTGQAPQISFLAEQPDWLQKEEELRQRAVKLGINISDKTPEQLEAILDKDEPAQA